MQIKEKIRPTRSLGWDVVTLNQFLHENVINEGDLAYTLQSAEGIRRATELVTSGRAIAGHNLGVNFLFGDAAQPLFIEEVILIKGEERINKPLGTCFDATTLIDMIDIERIPVQLQSIFRDPKQLKNTFGSLAFLRVHIKEEAIKKYNLPEVVLSRTSDGTAILQNWLTQGNSAMTNFGWSMQKAGVRVPAITSLNKSGEGETVHQEDGILFSRKNNIPLFLYNPELPPRYENLEEHTDYAVGSNPVLSFDRDGVYIERQGYQEPNIWQEHIAQNFGVPVIDRSNTRPRFPQMKIPPEFIKILTETHNPRLVRIGILRYMLGESTTHISSKLKLNS